MPFFRKKPIRIEAVKFTGKNGKKIKEWAAKVGGSAEPGVGSYEGRASDVIRVTTLEGIMLAGPGDWIIRGVAGEIYPCKAAIFKATYDPSD